MGGGGIKYNFARALYNLHQTTQTQMLLNMLINLVVALFLFIMITWLLYYIRNCEPVTDLTHWIGIFYMLDIWVQCFRILSKIYMQMLLSTILSLIIYSEKNQCWESMLITSYGWNYFLVPRERWGWQRTQGWGEKVIMPRICCLVR